MRGEIGIIYNPGVLVMDASFSSIPLSLAFYVEIDNKILTLSICRLHSFKFV